MNHTASAPELSWQEIAYKDPNWLKQVGGVVYEATLTAQEEDERWNGYLDGLSQGQRDEYKDAEAVKQALLFRDLDPDTPYVAPTAEQKAAFAHANALTAHMRAAAFAENEWYQREALAAQEAARQFTPENVTTPDVLAKKRAAKKKRDTKVSSAREVPAPLWEKLG